LAENRQQNHCQGDPQENLFRQIVQVSPASTRPNLHHPKLSRQQIGLRTAGS
jgi:hypothetical protein